MHVVKFIVGFIGGVAGLFISSAVLYFCFIRPGFMMTTGVGYPEGNEAVWSLLMVSVIAGILVLYIGASYTPKLWKWGIRIGSVAPVVLAVLPLLAEWTVNS